jgi:hypothetical protein
MTKAISLVLALLLAVAPAMSMGESDPSRGAPRQERTAAGTGSSVLLAQADEQGQQRAPESAPSQAEPPSGAPPEAPPAPPFADQQRPAQPQQSPPGQWVYTQQYGWLWMPYGDDYTYVPPDGYGEPYLYVYYPVFGWTWVVAPWVWGFGPWPWFGLRGPVSFAWWRHGWWRSPWRWRFAPGPRFGPHFAFHGVRPVGPRGPFVWRGAPARAAVVPRGTSHGVFHGGGRHR